MESINGHPEAIVNSGQRHRTLTHRPPLSTLTLMNTAGVNEQADTRSSVVGERE